MEESSAPLGVEEKEAQPFWPYNSRKRIFHNTDKEQVAKQDPAVPQLEYST